MKFDILYKKLLKERFESMDLSKFLTKRKEGAAKLAKASKEKGGVSILTSLHFKAKDKPYKEALNESHDKPLEHCKAKALECLDKLKDLDSLTQDEFQKITGELEAYGESYIQSK